MTEFVQQSTKKCILSVSPRTNFLNLSTKNMLRRNMSERGKFMRVRSKFMRARSFCMLCVRLLAHSFANYSGSQVTVLNYSAHVCN